MIKQVTFSFRRFNIRAGIHKWKEVAGKKRKAISIWLFIVLITIYY